jgi:hypothetical protein
MAIYHFSVKAMSRADGKSAVACAAYRAGEKLVCEYYGKVQDYTRKTGVEHSQIYAPDNTQEKLLDRQNLWNAVEKAERRKDALLAREFEIAFPNELNAEQRKKMLDELCQNLVKKHGVIVDAAIHAPHTHAGSDERNYHAHIMFTTRSIDPNHGGFSAKKYRDFSRDNGTKTVSEWREYFADLTNEHLAKAGFAVRVDHRSYEDQKNGLEATAHEGPKATQLRRLGVTTEITINNDAIKQRNTEKIKSEQLLKDLDQEILATAKLISEIDQEIIKSCILSDEKTADSNSFDQIIQNSTRIRSEKNIFDTLDSSISQLNRSELFSQLDKTLENHAEAESKAVLERESAVKAEVERQAQLKANTERKVQAEREAEAERKAALEHDRKNRGNDFNF